MNQAERDRLILSLAPRVRGATARLFRRMLTAVEYEDMLSEAWTGAISAVDSFDASRGFTLGTYAEYKITGRILDYLRSMDVVGRRKRQKIKAGKASAPVIIPIVDAVDKSASRATESIEARHDIKRILARTKLGRRDRAILRRRFWQDESLHEIASFYGVCDSRISQLNSRILRNLRNHAG